MSRIFISHSSGDNAAALAIARWLSDAGWDDYFLDITPERGLAPGERWQAALKAAADRCEAVLFLISPTWQRSRWCLAEFLLAKQLGKAIFGVLIAPTPIEQLPEEMTVEWQLCDLVQGGDLRTYVVELEPHVQRTEVRFASAGLDRLRIGLKRAGLDPSTFPWPPANDPERSPYPGLRALDAEDAAVLFGRDALIVRGLDQLRRMRERGVEHLFAIVGASGAGKSSFMRAGLLPRLARDDRLFLPLPVIRPERASITGPEGLLASLERAFKARGATRSRAHLRGALDRPLGLASLLRELRDLRARPPEDAAAPPTIVVPIDQGEELFSADAGVEGAALLEHLSILVSPGAIRPEVPHAIVLGSIRADSLDLLQGQPSLHDLPTVLFNLPPVARGEFKGIIEGPAARHTAAGHKLSIEPALTERLMADAEGADAMPLLALTLQRLYFEHGGDGALTLDAYERMGGLRGAIEAAVDAAFAEPSRPPAVPEDARDRLDRLRHAFVPWLAGVDPDSGERKRRVARWEDIPEASRPLLDRLVAQRLLVKDRRRMREGDDPSVVVEVAHEALIRQWPPLRGWLDEEEADLRNLEALRRAAAEWLRNDRGAEWLVHTGTRLDDAQALTRWPDFKTMLGEGGLAYLQACRKRDDEARAEREAQTALIARQQALVEEEQKRTAKAQARTARQQRWTKVALALVALVLAGSGSWIVKQTRDVARQTSFVVAQNAEHVDDAFLVSKSGPEAERALRLSVVASRSSAFAPSHPAAAVQLARAAQSFRSVQTFALGGGSLETVLSPDGTRLLVTDSKRGTLQVWDTETGAEIGKLTGFEGRVRHLFGPDDLCLTWGGKGPPLLWNLKTGKTIARLTDQEGNVFSMQIALRGTRLVSRAQQSAPRLWNAMDGRLIGTLGGRDSSGGVGVIFGPNDRRAITLGKDSAPRLWDVADGRLVATLDGHSGTPAALFSHDGKRIVTYRTAGGDVPQLWNAETGERIARLEGHVRAPRAWFLADDTRIVTYAEGEASRLWDAASGKLVAVLGATSRPVLGRAGDRLVTVSGDGAMRLWNCTDGRAVAQLRAAGSGSASRVSFSSDGKRLWLQTGAKTVAVWDAVNGVVIADIDADSKIESVTFLRGGDLLLTRTSESRQIWDSLTGAPVLTFDKEANLNFNRLQTLVVATGKGVSPKLWSTNGERVMELKGQVGHVDSTFSPDERRLLITGDRGVAQLWDTANGKLVATLPVGRARYEFTRDGTRLLTIGRDNEARLWDATTGRLLLALSGQTQQIERASLSTDQSRLLVVSEDGTAHVWDATVPGTTLRHEDGPITHSAMTADGRRLAISVGRSVRMLDLPERKIVYSAERSLDDILFAVPGLGMITRFGPNAVRVLNPDSTRMKVRSTLVGDFGRILAASASAVGQLVATASTDGIARVWRADDGSLVHELKGHQGAVEGAAFSLDGKMIATRGADHVGRLWDAKTGRQITALRGHTDAVTLIAFAPKAARVITSSADGSARVWDTKAAADRPIAILAGHPRGVRSGMLSYDGKRAVTVSGSFAYVWDVDHGKRLRTITGGEAELVFANLDEKGDRVITVASNGGVRVWNVATGMELARFAADTPLFRVGLDEKGETAFAVSKDGTVQSWDVKTRAPERSSSAHLTINSLAIDPTGRRLLVGWSDGIARVHDGATGKVILTYAEHQQAVDAVALASDGRRAATGSADGAVRIWDADGGATLKVIAERGSGITAVAFSPDGRLLATASEDNLVRLWDVETGQETAKLAGHASAVLSLAFAPDGRHLVTATQHGTARIWDVATRRTVAVMNGNGVPAQSAMLDSRGRLLVTASNDRASNEYIARVWDVETGKLLAEFDDSAGRVDFAAFTPDDLLLVTASEDGMVREWKMDWLARSRDESLIRAVCKERLVGASSIVTAEDIRNAPLLTGHLGEDVCAGLR